MHTVLLLLGGNLGPVKQNFATALTELESHGSVSACSALYRTQAWQMNDAPEFLNQAVILQTTLEPLALLEITHEIEHRMGRKRDNGVVDYQSRSLDIDILLIDKEIIDAPELKVPHPRMHLRKFTMVPAAEIAGNWQHPVLDKDLVTLNNDCLDTLNVVPV